MEPFKFWTRYYQAGEDLNTILLVQLVMVGLTDHSAKELLSTIQISDKSIIQIPTVMLKWKWLASFGWLLTLDKCFNFVINFSAWWSFSAWRFVSGWRFFSGWGFFSGWRICGCVILYRRKDLLWLSVKTYKIFLLIFVVISIYMLTLESRRFPVLCEVSLCIKTLPNRLRNRARSYYLLNCLLSKINAAFIDILWIWYGMTSVYGRVVSVGDWLGWTS